MPAPPMLLQVFQDLVRSLRRIAAFLALLVIVALASLAIAVPLWYVSSNFSGAYTAVVLLLLGAALITGITVRIIRLSREPRAYVRETILPILRTAAVVVASVAVLYLIAILISRTLTIAAIVIGALWLLLLGFLKYGRRAKR